MGSFKIITLIATLLLSIQAFHLSKFTSKRSSFIAMAASSPTDGVIVGGGRIGNLLYELNDKKDILLSSRDDKIPVTKGPIYVCTRNNDLDAIRQIMNSKTTDEIQSKYFDVDRQKKHMIKMLNDYKIYNENYIYEIFKFIEYITNKVDAVVIRDFSDFLETFAKSVKDANKWI